MAGDEDEIIKWIKSELERIKKEEPAIGEAIGPIVLLNLAEGRVEKFLENGTTQTVEEYIQRVVHYYKADNEFVQKLKAEDAAAWEAFLRKLGKWAYAFLRRKGVPVEVGRYQIADDCAHESGARLANIRFPYDVQYDGWACRVTHNVCLNYIRKHTDKLEYVDYDLTETAEWLEALSNPSGTIQSDKRLDLLDAIDQLSSEDRKTFILLYYFEGKDFDEIAEVLDRTKNALYKLHFDALENLRKIL
jgi:RNA polymerase sigma factor (sigma-70 family)